MKRIIIVIILLMAAAAFVSCGAKAGDETMNTEDNSKRKNNTEKVNMEQTGYTAPVPSAYLKSTERQGTVEHLRYDSKDYSGSGAAVTKDAYVYLPYGYDGSDENTRYDIIYLMHGWGGHAGEYFEMSSIKNVFDNMIEKGDMKPAIIVSATFCYEVTSCQAIYEITFLIVSTLNAWAEPQVQQSPALATLLFVDWLPTGQWSAVNLAVYFRESRYFYFVNIERSQMIRT